jgi:hypothetical protein
MLGISPSAIGNSSGFRFIGAFLPTQRTIVRHVEAPFVSASFAYLARSGLFKITVLPISQTRTLPTLLRLAISFALTSLAQEKEDVNPSPTKKTSSSVAASFSRLSSPDSRD